MGRETSLLFILPSGIIPWMKVLFAHGYPASQKASFVQADLKMIADISTVEELSLPELLTKFSCGSSNYPQPPVRLIHRSSSKQSPIVYDHNRDWE
jgi:hypothetical protein